MQRLFTTFPGGRPGVGLLLLRLAVAMIAMHFGVDQLSGSERGWVGLGTGSVALAISVCLLAGLLTIVAGGVMVAGTLAAGVSRFAAGAVDLPVNWFTVGLVMLVAASVALLGPGAISVDARLFGRREIIIPPSSRAKL